MVVIMDYIRKTYNVPAKQGGVIEYQGKIGRILGASGGYLRIKLDGEKRVGLYHPTYNITYYKTYITN